jgi:hypothetical protein
LEVKVALCYGIGGLVQVPQGAIKGNGPPPTSFKGQLGQMYFDESQTPAVLFVYNGTTWDEGGNATATQLVPGLVTMATFAELSTGTADNTFDAAFANDVYTYVNSVAVAGAPDATTVTKGIVFLATNADVVSPYATPLGANTVLTPANIATIFAAPPASGGTTPAAGIFTTLQATGLFTGSASATINTAGTALNLATDVDTAAVNIGTGAAARVITIGNVTGATAVAINTGTGHFTVTTTTTGDIILNSADTVLIDSAGVLELNSSAGVISIGNDAVSQNINIGTAGTRAIAIGNSTATTSVSINGGTGSSVNIGTNAIAHTITIGNVTGATAVVIDSGTGAINIGTSIAKTITIGNTTGATGLVERVGTGNYSLDGAATSTYTVGASTTTGTITIGGTAQTGDIVLGSSSGTNAVKIMNGSGAGTLSLGVVQVAGAINMGTAMTTGTITVGGTGLQTGTISIAPGTGAQTVNIATGGTGIKTVNIGTGAIGNVITIGTVTGAASLALKVGTGNFSLDGAATSTYTIGPSTTTGTITIGGTAETGTITLGSSSGTNIVDIGAGTGATTVNIAGGAGSAKAVNIGTGAVSNVITIGSVTTTSGISLLVGTGNFSLDGAATSTYTFAPSTTSGTINFGGTGANTGTATILGGTGAQTINIANNTGIKTINIAGDAATSANIIRIGTGAGAQTVTLGSTTTTSTTTINSGSGNINATGGNLKIATTGKGLQIKTGAVTDMAGSSVLVLGTVTVANTNIATGDLIFLSRIASNGSVTLGELSYTISNGASFTVTSLILGTPASTQTADVSSFAYFIVRGV